MPRPSGLSSAARPNMRRVRRAVGKRARVGIQSGFSFERTRIFPGNRGATQFEWWDIEMYHNEREMGWRRSVATQGDEQRASTSRNCIPPGAKLFLNHGDALMTNTARDRPHRGAGVSLKRGKTKGPPPSPAGEMGIADHGSACVRPRPSSAIRCSVQEKKVDDQINSTLVGFRSGS